MLSSVPVSRRHVLLGAAGLALLGAAVACGDAPPLQDVDALLGQLERARSDSRLATDVAAARPASGPPAVIAALSTVAAQRTEHAEALANEITRISGDAPASSTPSTPSPSSTATSSTSAAPVTPPTAADVVAALKQSADGAALLASQQSGYRAGLLGSVAAACTAAATVGLAGVGRPT